MGIGVFLAAEGIGVVGVLFLSELRVQTRANIEPIEEISFKKRNFVRISESSRNFGYFTQKRSASNRVYGCGSNEKSTFRSGKKGGSDLVYQSPQTPMPVSNPKSLQVG